MKNLKEIILGASLLALLFTSCQDENPSNDNLQSDTTTTVDDKNIIPYQYIVVFKDNRVAPASKQLAKSSFTSRKAKAQSVAGISKTSISKINSILSDNDIDKSKVLNYYTTEISGVAIRLTDMEFDRLIKDDNVEVIEFDRIIEIPEMEVENLTTKNSAQRMSQVTPCGINNAGGSSNGSGKSEWIWIVDSGIDLDHPDLNVVTNNTYAKSFIDNTPNDCHGHGTHVAGTAAAIDNGFGVVGVSSGAPVVPVKVLNCSNRGSTSGILAGINHVGKYFIAGDVVNLSLGGYFGWGCGSYSSYRNSLLNLGQGGAYVSIAAGNDSADASYFEPACVNGQNIFTIASMTCNRNFSSFSNYNMNPVDFIATGSNVYSTYLNGGYATLGGTSMAAPHVAGVMHAKGGAPNVGGYVYNRGEYYPVAVK